jgi:hypothetical protein
VEEAALFQFWRLLATNELKVFTSLTRFLEEYRIGDEQPALLVCAQALVSRLDLMRCAEEYERDDDDEFGMGSTTYHSGHAAWMR